MQATVYQHLLFIRFHVQAAESELVFKSPHGLLFMAFLACRKSTVTNLVLGYCWLFYSMVLYSVMRPWHHFHVLALLSSTDFNICMSVLASFGR